MSIVHFSGLKSDLLVISFRYLSTMPSKIPAQDISDSIVEAAVLVIEGQISEVENVSARQLAKRSGFAVGTLYRYFRDKDHLLSKVWLFFITRLHATLVPKIDSFPDSGTIRQLMMLICDHYFQDLSKRKPSRAIPLYRLFIKASVDPENMAKPIDVLIGPLMRAQKRNTTGTMKIMDENEVRIYLRGALAMVRSDFLEENPYFATQSHQRLMLDALVCLFQK
jgi:AcrR family transcriptional regulator